MKFSDTEYAMLMTTSWRKAQRCISWFLVRQFLKTPTCFPVDMKEVGRHLKILNHILYGPRFTDL